MNRRSLTADERLLLLEKDAHSYNDCPTAGKLGERITSLEKWKFRGEGAIAVLHGQWGFLGGIIAALVLGVIWHLWQ